MQLRWIHVLRHEDGLDGLLGGLLRQEAGHSIRQMRRVGEVAR
jgi:hypothetical protein